MHARNLGQCIAAEHAVRSVEQHVSVTSAFATRDRMMELALKEGNVEQATTQPK